MGKTIQTVNILAKRNAKQRLARISGFRQPISERRYRALMPSRAPVQVFSANLDLVPGQLLAVLSPPERERVERIRQDRPRRRSAAARAVLRDLLSRLVGEAPQELELQLGSHGKPQLRCSSISMPHFNISHSGELAVFAFSADQEVGIDIEALSRLGSQRHDELAIAQRLLGPHVVESLQALGPKARARPFLAAWVAHEAVVKCLGGGIVGVPEELAKRVRSEAGPVESESWSQVAGVWVRAIDAGEGAVAALALSEAPAEVTLQRWSPASEVQGSPAA